MPTSEPRQARKVMAALLGFLARGPARAVRVGADQAAGQHDLRRDDGARRKVEVLLLHAAQARGLLEAGQSVDPQGQTTPVYRLTPEGRCAVRRWLADPDSAFQDQHRALSRRTDPDHGHLKINDAESPLAVLARIKGRDGAAFLEPSQVEAGERLRRDFTRGQMQPSLGQRWEPVLFGRQPGAAGGAVDVGEAALAARTRVNAALSEVGPELSGVLIDICCFLKRLSEVERERHWPARSAKLMLRTALAALARHYAAPRRPLRPPRAPPLREP
ncbi:DUF6456 domain-containing protein [Hoeflea sp. YIM 152468]|uniref:DUF6456 domain-containing protein n=1 Tax=Hoeflea sp. YIM 152468 TaxID=3031759 RepID=UPI0023DC6654|nr:DUF6456 domain-containing protein [Hoeflea sp. YIM 152468]MDF1607300.1 DUF6456 domain-containing protein [Hoeflea sp. YIM 152468]